MCFVTSSVYSCRIHSPRTLALNLKSLYPQAGARPKTTLALSRSAGAGCTRLCSGRVARMCLSPGAVDCGDIMVSRWPKHLCAITISMPERVAFDRCCHASSKVFMAVVGGAVGDMDMTVLRGVP